METTEGNKLIERFWIERGGTPHAGSDLSFYESSWDMLMPVVEKIIASGFYFMWRDYMVGFYRFNDMSGKLSEAAMISGVSPIQALWKAVVQFIQWYNEQKPSA